MEEIVVPDYIFVYGILNREDQKPATLYNVVKVQKAYNNMHVCLEHHDWGVVDGSMLPVRDAEHLAVLDSIEGDGYRRVTIPNVYGKVIHTYWYKDMPLDVDTSTGEANLVFRCGLTPEGFPTIPKEGWSNAETT